MFLDEEDVEEIGEYRYTRFKLQHCLRVGQFLRATRLLALSAYFGPV